MKQAILLALTAGLVGCGGQETSFMPLAPGRQWGYEVKAGFQRSVATIKVTDRVAVGGTPGFRLLGSYGESRLAWKEGRLICSELANCRFTSPLPLLDLANAPADAKSEEFKVAQRWKAKIESFGQTRPATAILKQRRTKLAGNPALLIQSRVEITVAGSNMEIVSWFENGKGIVKQEQRTNGNLVVAAELLRFE